MKGSRAVVITGMHRSGTSLVAALLQQAGVDIGRNLLPGNSGNPYGHFEDTEFMVFQAELLRARGLDMFVNHPVDFGATPVELEQATRLIDARAEKPLWGWKDPRTSLFLEFWHQLLPKASYIFLYRHPLEVVTSLMRRGDFLDNGRLELGLQSWCVYNERIVSFYRKNSNSCVMGNIYRLIDNLDAFRAILGQKVELELWLDSPAETLYRPRVLNRIHITHAAENALREIYPPAMALYRQIEELADLPAGLSESLSSPEPDLSGLRAYLRSQPEPLTAAQIRSSLLMLISLIAPAIFGQYYTGISDNLYKTTTEREQLREKAQIWGQQVREYETRFQSQDMMTRHFLELTFNNFLDIWRNPKAVMRKFNRWVHFRINRGNQVN
jgi:hypothetical protein